MKRSIGSHVSPASFSGKVGAETPRNSHNTAAAHAKGFLGDGMSCFDTAGRFFMKQDDFTFYTGDAITLSDGNVLVTGEYYSWTQNIDCGFLLKCDDKGDIIWAKKVDSTNRTVYNFINYYRTFELKNGDIAVGGFTYNPVSDLNELIITRFTSQGEVS